MDVAVAVVAVVIVSTGVVSVAAVVVYLSGVVFVFAFDIKSVKCPNGITAPL